MRHSPDTQAQMAQVYDMHCHLDFCPDTSVVVRELAKRSVAGGLCCMVTPDRQPQVAKELAGSLWPVGVGLHPWWVRKDRADLVEQARALIAEKPRLVGEIGLDFGRAHESTRDAQVAALRSLAEVILPGSVLSIHGVRSVNTVLDILEEHQLTRSCTCIMHWFSASSPELTRAVRTGCLFSIGTFMLATKRGREYARQLPAERLLLETDYPPQHTASDPKTLADDMSAALLKALNQLAEIRGITPAVLGEQIAGRSTKLIASVV